MLDFMTLAGLCGGLFCLAFGGIKTPEQAMLYWNLPSVFITLGGATCATLAQYSWAEISTIPGVLANAFRVRHDSPTALIESLVKYAEVARREGILALESVTAEIDNEFLVTGLQLAVDGTDPELIQQMMTTELEYLEERHERGRKIVETLAYNLPAFGLIGTVIGLINMLANLSDFGSIGANMAIALLTTCYGAIGAYAVCTPIAKKLDARSKQEVLIREIIIRGVMSIQSGDNPRIVRQKLKIFLPPNIRPTEPNR